MILHRFPTEGLAQVAYLVADQAAGVAAVIDPRRDIDDYLAWATAHDLRITAAIETHVHADFVSGAPELAAATGATIYASRLGNQTFPHYPLDDGAEVPVGRLCLRALWTPGHTPEHLAYLLSDPDQGTAPLALFSGDALFVGEVGRPDLLGASATGDLAAQLFRTVNERLRALPDDLLVWPGHTAGSSCGKQIGDAPRTTIGQEKRFNYAFQAHSEAAFVEAVLTGLAAPPTYYPILKRLNRVGAPLRRDVPIPTTLTPAEVASRSATGALVIDTRSPEAFGAGHLPGSVFVGLGSLFLTWMGWLAPYDRDLILILEDDADLPMAQTELQRIGLDRLVGGLAGGVAAWQASGRPLATLRQLPVTDLAARLAEPFSELVVLDVRAPSEWDSGHIPGTVHRFAGDFAELVSPDSGPASVDAALLRAKPLAVICGGGYRATLVASLLARHGHQHLCNVPEGFTAWQAAGLPIAHPSQT